MLVTLHSQANHALQVSYLLQPMGLLTTVSNITSIITLALTPQAGSLLSGPLQKLLCLVRRSGGQKGGTLPDRGNEVLHLTLETL